MKIILVFIVVWNLYVKNVVPLTAVHGFCFPSFSRHSHLKTGHARGLSLPLVNSTGVLVPLLLKLVDLD